MKTIELRPICVECKKEIKSPFDAVIGKAGIRHVDCNPHRAKNVKKDREKIGAILTKMQGKTTVEKHVLRIKSGKFTKSEIGALTKLIQSMRFSKNASQKEKIQELIDNNLEYVKELYDINADVYHFAKPAKITPEQTELGKQWLRNYFFKLDGTIRKGQATENISESVLNISKKVMCFEFIGLVFCRNTFQEVCQVLPVYRTYNKQGEYFDYAPMHWSKPVIMEGL